MKKALITIVAVMLTAALLVLTGCDLLGEVKITTDSREECNELAQAFIDETVKKTNVKMVEKIGDETVMTYERDGDTVKKDDFDGMYAFLKEGKKYVLYTEDEDLKGYWESESGYDDAMDGLKVTLEMFLTFDEGFDEYTFSGEQIDKIENDVTESTLKITFSGKTEEDVTVTQTAELKATNGLISELKVTYTEGDETDVWTIEFTYDTVSIELPDLTQFDCLD